MSNSPDKFEFDISEIKGNDIEQQNFERSLHLSENEDEIEDTPSKLIKSKTIIDPKQPEPIPIFACLFCANEELVFEHLIRAHLKAAEGHNQLEKIQSVKSNIIDISFSAKPMSFNAYSFSSHEFEYYEQKNSNAMLSKWRQLNAVPYPALLIDNYGLYLEIMKAQYCFKNTRQKGKPEDKSSSFIPSNFSYKGTKSDFLLMDSCIIKTKMDIYINTSFSSDEHDIYSPKFSDTECEIDDDAFISMITKRSETLYASSIIKS